MKHVFKLCSLYLLILFVAACSKSNSNGSATKVATVTTIAGNGKNGYADGTGTAAQFDHPFGIAIDGSGNLYVGDENNSLIRKITTGGSVSTLAGSSDGFADGAGSAAKFFGTEGVAVDGGGNVYVADYLNNRIRKVTAAGVVTTFAGGTEGYADGTGSAAEFSAPKAVALDASGNVYVADVNNNCIRKITPAGVVTTLAGGSNTGPGNGAFADGTGTAAKFASPSGVTVDGAGNVYVADFNNFRVRKITPAGVVTTVAGSVDGESDGTGSAAEFGAPQGIVVAPSGTLYVTDYLSTVRQITTNGAVTTIVGISGTGFLDGVGTVARVSGPAGIAIDGSGNLYVADYGNGAIRKITFK
jgi:sugar lactone lactonase YvrE